MPAMGKYAVDMQRTASASASVGTLTCPGSGMRRIKVFFVNIGSEGSPADVANLWQFQRVTAAGTSMAVTPASLDTADAASTSVCGEAHTVEPTYTANTVLLNLALNQKATLQFQPNPGSELVIPATASNGIGVRTPTAGSSVAVTCQIHYEE